MKTKTELTAFLRRAVPDLVYSHIIQAGSLRQCGSISDAFGTIARSEGFDAFVASRPGHFYNVVQVEDGVFEVDLSAIQFEFDRWTDDEDAEMERLLTLIAKDPFRAIRVRRIDSVPGWASLPPSEDASVCYEPVAAFRLDRTARLKQGKFGSTDRLARDLLRGGPYAQEARPIELETTAPSYGMRMVELIEQRVMRRLLETGKRREKGTWSDVDSGRGGSVYNRNEPTRRQKKMTTRDAETTCRKLWDDADPDRREVAVGEWDADKAGAEARRLANLGWDAFIDAFFYTPLEEDADTTRRLKKLEQALRWASG